MIFNIILNQKAMQDCGWVLDSDCAILLSCCLKMASTSAYQKKAISYQDRMFFWFDYEELTKQVPMLFWGRKSNSPESKKKHLQRLFLELINNGYLSRHPNSGVLAKNYIAILDKSDCLTYDKSVTPPMTNLSYPYDKSVTPPMTNLSYNNSIIDNSINKENKEEVSDDSETLNEIFLDRKSAYQDLRNEMVKNFITPQYDDDELPSFVVSAKHKKSTLPKTLSELLSAERFVELATDAKNNYSFMFVLCKPNFDYKRLYAEAALYYSGKEHKFNNIDDVMSVLGKWVNTTTKRAQYEVTEQTQIVKAQKTNILKRDIY